MGQFSFCTHDESFSVGGVFFILFFFFGGGGGEFF